MLYCINLIRIRMCNKETKLIWYTYVYIHVLDASTLHFCIYAAIYVLCNRTFQTSQLESNNKRIRGLETFLSFMVKTSWWLKGAIFFKHLETDSWGVQSGGLHGGTVTCFHLKHSEQLLPLKTVGIFFPHLTMPWFRKKIIYCSRPLLLVWNEVALRSKRSRFKAFPAPGHGIVEHRVDHAKSEHWYSGGRKGKKLGMMMMMTMMYCPVKGCVFWSPKNLQDELMDSWLGFSRFPIPGTLDSLKLPFAFWKYLESQKEMKKHTEFPIPGCLRLSETNMTPEQSARTQKEASFSKHWFSEVKVAGARCSAFGTAFAASFSPGA